MTAEASDVVELAAAWLVFVTGLVAWRLEGLFDRVDVLERLAHPPSQLCTHCQQPAGTGAPVDMSNPSERNHP